MKTLVYCLVFAAATWVAVGMLVDARGCNAPAPQKRVQVQT